MKHAAAAFGAAAALALAACGGGSKTGHAATAARSTATASTSCDALGINQSRLREGTCKAPDGETVTIVNKRSMLRLDSLSAGLNSIRTATSIRSGVGSSAAKGRFVIISLTTTNRLGSAQVFDRAATPQTELHLNGRVFSEAFDAENGNDQGSCVSTDMTSLKPGQSTTCDVIFDVPTSLVRALDSTGNVWISNFGDDISSSTHPLGIIRTYH